MTVRLVSAHGQAEIARSCARSIQHGTGVRPRVALGSMVRVRQHVVLSRQRMCVQSAARGSGPLARHLARLLLMHQIVLATVAAGQGQNVTSLVAMQVPMPLASQRAANGMAKSVWCLVPHLKQTHAP